MNTCLAIIRIAIYVGIFGLFIAIGACGHILFFLSPSRLLQWIAYFSQWWARITCWVFNIHIQVEGDGPPLTGAMVVANHVGSPDIFILGACFKGFFVSKVEIADWPLFNWLVRLGKTIFADRNKRHQVKSLIHAIAKRLHGGHNVILFPEAQATDGSDVVPFKSAIFEAAVLANRPVVPVSIHYHDGNQPTLAFYGDSFLSHIMTLLKTPRLQATVTIFPEIPASLGRQALADKSCRVVRDAVKAQNSQLA